MQIEQSEAAMERQGGKITLLKDVGKSPKAVHVHQACRLDDCLDRVGRRVRLVLGLIATVGGAVPLRVIERKSPGFLPGRPRPLPQDASAAVRQLSLGVLV